jgi:hypothetical protein
MHPFSCRWAQLRTQLVRALWKNIHVWAETIPKSNSKAGQDFGSYHGKVLKGCTSKRMLAALCVVLSVVMVSTIMDQTIHVKE